MTHLLLGVAILILVTVAVGLVRVVRGPTAADRMMGAQLFGTGGVAVLLLLGVARDLDAAFDTALILAFLAPFATIAFARFAPIARSRP